MGPIMLVLALVATWVLVALVFVAGFAVGRVTQGLAGERKVTIARRGKTVAPLTPSSSVPGVDVPKEKLKIIARAKEEFGMNQSQAEQFAEQVTKEGAKVLGRLHSSG